MDRYQVKTDKNSKITNDPNAYSDGPAYILKLLLSIITVSIKSMELVQSLPSIDFDSLAPASETERQEEKQKIHDIKQAQQMKRKTKDKDK